MTRIKSLTVKHISRADNKVAHYALSMFVGLGHKYKFFLNAPPFAQIAYKGDLQAVATSLESKGAQINVRDHTNHGHY